jgi:vacuolar protein-sorting-associated protein 4
LFSSVFVFKELGYLITPTTLYSLATNSAIKMDELRETIGLHYHMYHTEMDKGQPREAFKDLRCVMQAMIKLEPLTTGEEKDALQCQMKEAMGHWKSLSMQLSAEMKKLSFDDIIGHDKAKKCLKSALKCFYWGKLLGLEVECPNILLYGQSGSGKSYLAEAMANECSSSYTRVSIAELKSKYHGDSEKAMKKIFEVARKTPKSVIFFDELHLIFSTIETEEVSKGIKKEFLIEMSSPENSDIVIIGATNMPWMLESAILRRFDKKIGLALPDAKTRAKILQKRIESSGIICCIKPKELELIAKKLDGYTPSDLAGVAKTAQNLAIEDVSKASFVTSGIHRGRQIHVICKAGSKGARKINMEKECKSMNVKTVMIKCYLDKAVMQTSKSSISAEDIYKLDMFNK